MNKEKFYDCVIEKTMKELLELSTNKEMLSYFLVSSLSILKDKEYGEIENDMFTKVHMTLIDALSICVDLKVDETEVFLKDSNLILFKGNPHNLSIILGSALCKSIECTLYNGGHSIMVHYIDKEILGDSND